MGPASTAAGPGGDTYDKYFLHLCNITTSTFYRRARVEKEGGQTPEEAIPQ